jgi:hypothetical protein
MADKTENDKEKRYIELVYSIDSPLNSIEDLLHRKKKAAIRAGYLEGEERAQLIMDMKVDSVNQKIFTYLKKQSSNKFMKLIADQQLYYRMMEKVLFYQESDDESGLTKAARLSRESEEVMNRIQSLYNEIFRSQPELMVVAEHNVAKMLAPELRIKKNIA